MNIVLFIPSLQNTKSRWTVLLKIILLSKLSVGLVSYDLNRKTFFILFYCILGLHDLKKNI